ncbi:MAG: putative multidrug efflux protein AdeT1 [Aquirhabdus sp.]
MNTSNKILLAAVLLATVTATSQAQTFCVFDPSGTQGDSYTMMKDYSLIAKGWGAEPSLKAYQDEAILAKDFKSGKCDAAAITAIRSRQFNNFVASIESIGGIVNKSQTKTIISLMANPKLAPLMVDNGVEVAGVLAIGPGYLMTNDRNINTIQKIVGQRLAIFDYDVAGQTIVEKVGATPVLVTLGTVGPKFNSGQIDIIYLPAIAFKPFDIAKGIGTKGGVIRFPIVAATYDVLIHPEKFPDGYGQKSRTWFAGNINRQMALVDKIEKSIDNKYWIDIPPVTIQAYNQVMREIRISLAKSDIYDKRMMRILKKVRCQQEPDNVECSKNYE